MFLPDGFRHALAGEHISLTIRGGGLGESFARCPNCSRPLHRIFTVPSEIVASLTGRSWNESVDMLFCWQCRAAEKLIYQSSGEGLRFIDWQTGTEGYPIWEGYPDAFPKFEIPLAPQLDIEKEVMMMLYEHNDHGVNLAPEVLAKLPGDVIRPRHQVGGFPYLEELPPPRACPICGHAMKIFATGSNFNGTQSGFCDYDFVVMVFAMCFDCFVTHAFHQVD